MLYLHFSFLLHFYADLGSRALAVFGQPRIVLACELRKLTQKARSRTITASNEDGCKLSCSRPSRYDSGVKMESGRSARRHLLRSIVLQSRVEWECVTPDQFDCPMRVRVTGINQIIRMPRSVNRQRQNHRWNAQHG